MTAAAPIISSMLVIQFGAYYIFMLNRNFSLKYFSWARLKSEDTSIRDVCKVVFQGLLTGYILISNPLLTDVELPKGVEVDANADDLRVKIRANSRRGIENAATAAITAIYNWGMQNRLSYAPD